MTQTVENGDRRLTFEELPDSLAGLTVAGPLVSARITADEGPEC